MAKQKLSEVLRSLDCCHGSIARARTGISFRQMYDECGVGDLEYLTKVLWGGGCLPLDVTLDIGEVIDGGGAFLSNATLMDLVRERAPFEMVLAALDKYAGKM